MCTARAYRVVALNPRWHLVSAHLSATGRPLLAPLNACPCAYGTCAADLYIVAPSRGVPARMLQRKPPFAAGAVVRARALLCAMRSCSLTLGVAPSAGDKEPGCQVWLLFQVDERTSFAADQRRCWCV